MVIPTYMITSYVRPCPRCYRETNAIFRDEDDREACGVCLAHDVAEARQQPPTEDS